MQRTEPFLHYEWLSIYARVKEAMDNGLSMEDAVSKEDEIISKKLKEVYPYKYSQFKDITDEEKGMKSCQSKNNPILTHMASFLKLMLLCMLNLQILLSY